MKHKQCIILKIRIFQEIFSDFFLFRFGHQFNFSRDHFQIKSKK